MSSRSRVFINLLPTSVLLLLLLLLATLHLASATERLQAHGSVVAINVQKKDTGSAGIDDNDQVKASQVNITSVNCSLAENVNDTKCVSKSENGDGDGQKSLIDRMTENKGMLLRTFYVTMGITGIVVIYFVVRAVRLRRQRTKSRKYGIITQSGDHGDMEMEPLGDGDDEDDDYTVFELNGRKK